MPLDAYYNEIDPEAAATLRELIKRGLIAPGEVDERDIRDVAPNELSKFAQCHFFAGIGGWSLALRLAGWPDDLPVWTGSCPCQPFSAAGLGNGFDDERHLWPAWQYLIAQRRPPIVFGEQVSSKDALDWLDLVSADLERARYSVGTSDLCAAGVGAPHKRQRLYFVACELDHAKRPRLEGLRRHDFAATGRPAASRPASTAGAASIVDRIRRRRGLDEDRSFWRDSDWLECSDRVLRPVEPGSRPLAHGIPDRMGRLRFYGNAIVPQLAQAFIESSIEALLETWESLDHESA
jgi:DNA (cytosine-5)-methyltransferase 1